MARRREGAAPALIAAAQAGDDAALAAVHDSVVPRLVRLVAFNLGDDQVARELVADVMPQVLATIPHFRRSCPSAEAHCVAAAFPLLRKADKRSLPAAEFQMPSHYLDEADALTIDAVDPGDEVLSGMRQLPPLWQELLELRILAAMTIEDAAYVMNRQVAPLTQLQLRALLALSEWIDQLSDKTHGSDYS